MVSRRDEVLGELLTVVAVLALESRTKFDVGVSIWCAKGECHANVEGGAVVVVVQCAAHLKSHG